MNKPNTPTALTANELHILRFAPEDFRTTPTTRGYDTEVRALAARGLLRITACHDWAIDYVITTAGTTAVWDHAPESIRHLRGTR